VIPVVLPGVQRQVRLTRGELEAMVRPRLRETLDALERTVSSAGLTMEGVDRILLVGGSSRMPLINAMLREATGRPIVVDAHPKFAVASGAAITAAARLHHEPAAAVAAVAAPAPAPAPMPETVAAERSRTPVLVGAIAAVVAVIAAVVLLSGGGDGDGDGQEVATEDTTTTVGDSESEPTTTAAPASSVTTLADGVEPCPDVALGACITELRIDGDQLLASYHVNFEPTLDPSPAELPEESHHMHFFFDTVAPEDAGTQSANPGEWRIWATPSPFGGEPQNNGDPGFVLADIPEAATGLCVLVAERDHSVLIGSGNCARLP
jgi:cell division ATPase FtsA